MDKPNFGRLALVQVVEYTTICWCIFSEKASAARIFGERDSFPQFSFFFHRVLENFVFSCYRGSKKRNRDM